MATERNDAQLDPREDDGGQKETEESLSVDPVDTISESNQEKDIDNSDNLTLDLNGGEEVQQTGDTTDGVTERTETAEESDAVQTGDRDGDDKNDDKDEGISDKDEEEKEDEVEEEEEPETEMTEEEKEAMYTAVCEGDIAVYQNCLDKPNADINATWFNENMLMVAMRTGQMMMAEFLIDIGIDVNYEIDLIDLYEKEKTGNKRFDCYRKSCRQIAWENGHDFIVELIDLKNDNWFPYKKKTQRWYKYTRRPLPPPLPRVPGEEEEVEEDDEENAEEGDENGEKGEKEGGDVSSRKETKKDEDVDSGHHSGKFDEIRDVDDNISFLSGERPMFELNDDGYWSLTQRSSPYMCPPEKPERPGILTRGTKSSILLRKHTNQILDHRKCSNSAKERNITVVQAVGSYAQESKLWKRKSVDHGSVESIPFLARMHSAKTTCSEPVRTTQNHFRSSRRQRPLTTQSAFSQVTKILGESPLLRPQKEPPLPFINTTQQRHPLKRTTKVNPWCHGNSTGVMHKLSNVKIQNKVVDPNFHVERQLYQRTRSSYSGIS